MRNIVVTGAARGIGRAIATHFIHKGDRVALVDQSALEGRRVAQRLGKRASFIHCDLVDPMQVRALADDLKAWPRLDGLVNNAGLLAFKAFEALSVEEWDRVLGVNLRAAWLCVQTLLPKLKAGSAVVNIASTRALMSEPSGEAYASSKGGLVSLTHALAVSLQRRRIRVNAVLPGWIDTTRYNGSGTPLKLRKIDREQHLVGRLGRPEDIAEAVDFLLDGKRSGFMCGQKLVVDGGMAVKMNYAE